VSAKGESSVSNHRTLRRPVEVKSELGKGTRFRLTFPAIPNDLAVVVEDQEHELELGVK